jgi:type IV fimbrial biogenesis protein FimT
MLSLSLKHKLNGFSLVELMVAIAIFGIVAALGIPSYKVWIQNTRIRTASESIQNGLQIARAEAVKRNSPVQFDFRNNHSAWTVCTRPAVPGSCPAADDATTLQSRSAGEGSSADVIVTTVNAGPYVFNSFGTLISPVPTAADGLIRISIDVATSVLPASDSRDLSIIIGIGGNARMCDPALDSGGTDPRRCPA